MPFARVCGKMRWQFGGNLQPVRMICEFDWRECPSAIANYIWSEIVTDVVDCLTNEWLLWRVIAMLFVCTLLVHTIYSKTRLMEETTVNRDSLNIVGCKVQDLELKVNILTYKMQYGTWPLPRQIRGSGIEGGLRNVRLTLTNSQDRNAWLKHMLLSPSENAEFVPYAKIGPRSVRCLTKLINLETKYMASRFSGDASPASNKTKSSSSEKSMRYEKISKKSSDSVNDRAAAKYIPKSENLGMRRKDSPRSRRETNCWSETQVLKYRKHPILQSRNENQSFEDSTDGNKIEQISTSPDERENSIRTLNCHPKNPSKKSSTSAGKIEEFTTKAEELADFDQRLKYRKHSRSNSRNENQTIEDSTGGKKIEQIFTSSPERENSMKLNYRPKSSSKKLPTGAGKIDEFNANLEELADSDQPLKYRKHSRSNSRNENQTFDDSSGEKKIEHILTSSEERENSIETANYHPKNPSKRLSTVARNIDELGTKTEELANSDQPPKRQNLIQTLNYHPKSSSKKLSTCARKIDELDTNAEELVDSDKVLKHREPPRSSSRSQRRESAKKLSASGRKSEELGKSPEERVNSTHETLHQVKEKLESLHSVLRICGSADGAKSQEVGSRKELAESILQDLKNLGDLPTESESDGKTSGCVPALLDSNTEESQCPGEATDSTSEFEQCRSERDSSSARSDSNRGDLRVDGKTDSKDFSKNSRNEEIFFEKKFHDERTRIDRPKDFSDNARNEEIIFENKFHDEQTKIDRSKDYSKSTSEEISFEKKYQTERRKMSREARNSPEVVEFPGTKNRPVESSDEDAKKFVPRETKNAAQESPSSSQTELSKDSDAEDKSNATLLREALKFKKALLTRIELENEENNVEIDDSREGKIEDSDAESDEPHWPKAKSYFQSKLLDIISEEQSASSSTEKTSKTLARPEKPPEDSSPSHRAAEDLSKNSTNSKLALVSESSEYFSLSNLEEKLAAQRTVSVTRRETLDSSDFTEDEPEEPDEGDLKRNISELVDQSVKNIREYIEVFSQIQSDAIVETRRAMFDDEPTIVETRRAMFDDEPTIVETRRAIFDDEPARLETGRAIIDSELKDCSSEDSIMHFVNTVAMSDSVCEQLPRKLSEPLINGLLELETTESDEEGFSDFSLKRRPGSMSLAEQDNEKDLRDARSPFESADDDDRADALSSEPSCKELVMDYSLESDSDLTGEKLSATLNLIVFEEEPRSRDEKTRTDSPLTGRTVVRAASSIANFRTGPTGEGDFNGDAEKKDRLVEEFVISEVNREISEANLPETSSVYFTDDVSVDDKKIDEVAEESLDNVSESSTWILENPERALNREREEIEGDSAISDGPSDSAEFIKTEKNIEEFEEAPFSGKTKEKNLVAELEERPFLGESTKKDILEVLEKRPFLGETAEKNIIEEVEKRSFSGETVVRKGIDEEEVPSRANLSSETSGTYMDASSRDYLNSSGTSLAFEQSVLDPSPKRNEIAAASKSARGSSSSPLQQRVPWNTPRRGSSLNNSSSRVKRPEESNSKVDKSKGLSSIDKSNKSSSIDKTNKISSIDKPNKISSTDKSSKISSADKSKEISSTDKSNKISSTDKSSKKSKPSRSQSTSSKEAKTKSNLSLSGAKDLESSIVTPGRRSSKSGSELPERRSRSYATPRKSEASPRNSTTSQPAENPRPSRTRGELAGPSLESGKSESLSGALNSKASSRSCVSKTSSRSCIPVLRSRLENARQTRAKSPVRGPLTMSMSWSREARMTSDPPTTIPSEGSPQLGRDETSTVVEEIERRKERSLSTSKLPESRTVIYVNIVTEQEHSATRVVDPKKFLEYLKDRDLKIQSVLDQEIGVESTASAEEIVACGSPRILTVVSSAVGGEAPSDGSLQADSKNSALTGSWSLRVEQREIEVSAKPSVIDTSTSISDLLPEISTERPNGPPGKFKIFEVPKELTKDEYIVLLEALNQDPNLQQLREMHKLCNKLGLGFHE